MEGLSTLAELSTLNMNDNLIQKIADIGNCPKLDTLQLKNNKIGTHPDGDLESLKALLECPSLEVLDLSSNYISDPRVIDEVLVKLPHLRVLYVKGNPFTQKVSMFRKNMIHKIPTLRHLDDAPILDEDRRRAAAFMRGGHAEERKELDWIRQEKREAYASNHYEFKATIIRIRDEKAAKDGIKHHADNPLFGEVEKPEPAEEAPKKESMKDLMKKAKMAQQMKKEE